VRAVRDRRARAVLTLIIVAAVGVLIAAGLRDTLTFYRTPSEVRDNAYPAGERFRLGGQVVPGSMHSDSSGTRFDLTDGSARVTVVTGATLPGAVREGEEAIVEGSLDVDGVFRGDEVMAKHGNEYRPAGESR
jgi:cytochrome c-type biogenesis protein CcmE